MGGFGVFLCVFLVVGIVAGVVVNYVCFCERTNRYNNHPEIDSRDDYLKSLFIPGYYLWLMFKAKMDSFDK